MAVIAKKTISHNHTTSDRSACKNSGPTRLASCPNGGWNGHGFYGYLQVGNNCNVCGATLGGPVEIWESSCSASNCCTVNVNYDDSGVASATIVQSNNDTGVKDYSFKWKKNGIVLSSGSSYVPAIEGDYVLSFTGIDAKTGAQKTADIPFKIEYVSNWENVYVGNVKIYGMAMGEKFIKEVAVGEHIIK